jgi:hypothetical protein
MNVLLDFPDFANKRFCAHFMNFLNLRTFNEQMNSKPFKVILMFEIENKLVGSD